MPSERTVVIGGISSLAFLGFLLVIQHHEPNLLNVPAHWIAICILPILVSLVVGGYLKSFKGWGIELESALKQPVSSVKLVASDAISQALGDQKQSVNYLQNMSDERRRSIRWLSFKSEKKRYYRSNAVEAYLFELFNLIYLEVRSPSGQIEGYLPIRALRNEDGQADIQEIKRFIKAIENGEFLSEFSAELIDLKIRDDEDLVSVLRKMTDLEKPLAGLVDSGGKYKGVLLRSDVEEKIAAQVLRAAS